MTKAISTMPRLRALLSTDRLTGQAGWVAGPFAFSQSLRLGTNIILAGLLAPEIFGLMLLVNTLRTGTELLSDIGIGQSVVRSPNGDEPDFLNVAWTLQALRGALLALIIAAAAYPVAQIYGKPELAPILLAVSPVFLLTGFQSTSIFLIQRRMQLRKRAVYDVVMTIFHCAIPIGLALVMPTIWALIIGLVSATALTCVLSYFLVPQNRPRFVLDKVHVHEIVNFGKWIFLSTAVYFAATTFDRLYFVASLPLALAGVYSVSRSFSDVLAQLGQKAGALLVFPKVAAMGERRSEAAGKLRSIRFKVLLLVAAATGIAVSASDQFILLAYDERYHAGAFIIPILMISVWFGILSSFADSMLMGCSRPQPGARANLVKFLILCIGLPLAIAYGDLLTALAVLVSAEIGRWVTLVPSARGEGFVKFRDDLALIAVMITAALCAKTLLGWLGLVPSIAEWWELRGLLRVTG
jgi:O-antigen/teichoic acid export membrane protein